MNETQIIALINQWIIANGNNEITANVLRPILLAMVEQPNNLIGDLSELATTDTTTLVNAINSILQDIETIDNNSVKLHTGLDNPNDTPPVSFNIADFYAQYDVNNNLVDLFQYNGVNWVSTNPSDNGFVTQGTIEKSGNDYILSNGFSWIINDILYSNNSEQTFTIQPSGTNESRVDIIVTNGNGFELIQGIPSEGEGTASQPLTPPGSLLLTSIIIFENTISEPTPPIVGSPYVTKVSQEVAFFTPSSAPNGLPFDPIDQTTKYLVTSPVNFEIAGISSE